MGVFSKEWTEKIAYVMKNLGIVRAFVVHGLDGLDEISIVGETQISELKDNKVRTYIVKPEGFGFSRRNLKEIFGGDVEQSVKSAIEILEGGKGAKRDMVILNSAAAIASSGKVENVEDGIELAEKSIDSKFAMQKLEQLKNFYKK
jgi:anthranilate phosphoribosyltransferase